MLLQEQLLACQADADKPSNAQQIESSAPAWAHHGASLARQQWLVHTSAQLKADAAAKALASAADPAFAAALPGKRGFDIKAIIERAAKKIKDETKAKADQVEAKRQDLVRQAGIEYLRLSFGKKQKPAPNVLQEKFENVRHPEGVCVKLCGCVKRPVRFGFGAGTFFLSFGTPQTHLLGPVRTWLHLCGLCADLCGVWQSQ